MTSSLLYFWLILTAMTASRTFRAYDTPCRSNALRTYCWVIVEAPCRLPPVTWVQDARTTWTGQRTRPSADAGAPGHRGRAHAGPADRGPTGGGRRRADRPYRGGTDDTGAVPSGRAVPGVTLGVGVVAAAGVRYPGPAVGAVGRVTVRRVHSSHLAGRGGAERTATRLP